MQEQPKKAKTVQDFGKPVSFEAGSSIFEEGYLVAEPCVFLVLDGKVEVQKKFTPLQKESFLYEPGDVFGMLEAYTGTSRVLSARAITDVKASAFSRADFERAMSSNLGFALTAIRLMSRMLRQINSRIKKLG